MTTIFHRDFVKPYVACLVQPDDTPILKPERINTSDWLTLGINQTDFHTHPSDTTIPTDHQPPVHTNNPQTPSTTTHTTDQPTDKQTNTVTDTQLLDHKAHTNREPATQGHTNEMDIENNTGQNLPTDTPTNTTHRHTQSPTR